MFGKLFSGPLGTALSLPQMREAMQTRDRNAYPPRLGSRNNQALIKQAMDERFNNRPPEPDWMKSWGAVGGNIGAGASSLWDKMQESNAAQAAKLPGAQPTPSAEPAPTQAPVPLPQPRPASANETPWWMNSVDMLTAAGDKPAPAAPPRSGVELPPPRPRGSPPGTPMAQPASYDIGAIPGFNPDIQNMANPSEMGDLSGLKARTVIDPDTGRAMNDFYREDLTSAIGALLKRALGA